MRERLIFVPGLDGTGLMIHRQRPLLERRYEITAIRHRDEVDTMEELVEDLHAAIAAAAPDGEAVTVVGESFGGALSLSYALAYPDRVSRLVIVNSFAHYGARINLWLGYQLLRLTPWRVMPLVRRLAAPRMHSPSTSRDEIERTLELLGTTTRVGYRARLGILRRYDLRPRLNELVPPVLFLAADRDTLVPSVEQARLMQSLAPRADVRILEGHGHACLVAPDLDLAAILDDWITTGR